MSVITIISMFLSTEQQDVEGFLQSSKNLPDLLLDARIKKFSHTVIISIKFGHVDDEVLIIKRNQNS